MYNKKMLIPALLLSFSLFANTASVYAESETTTQNVEEGYTETTENWTSTVNWTENKGNKIFGKFYFPADFDDTKSYPVIIMSHGFHSTHQSQFEVAEWPQQMAENGYISYVFDFCGGSPDSLSDGDFMDMSVMTEVDDLNAVVDFVKAQTFADSNNLFLMGSSQGGLVSALTAAERSDDIKGMILMYPGFCIPDIVRNTYPDREEIPEDGAVQFLGFDLGSQYATDIYDIDVMKEISAFDGDTLIIHGIADNLVPYDGSVAAIEGPYADSSSELFLLNGENTEHGFDTFHEDTRAKAHDVAIDYMERETASK